MILSFFVDMDFGLTVALVGILVVFLALIVLATILTHMPKLFKIQIKQRLKKSGKNITETCCHDISGETSAAISLALHLFFNELHDQENMVMTIKKVSKRYSPWSSKIYGLNNYYYKKA